MKGTILEQWEIRLLVLEAIYSNDLLSELMVLKGGSAIRLYDLEKRESYDMDFSLLEFDKNFDEEHFRKEIENAIVTCFENYNYKIFGFKFIAKPKKRRNEQIEDWGGYNITFKFLPIEQFEKICEKNKKTKNKELSHCFYEFIGTKKAIEIEISKKEYCPRGKYGYKEKDLEGIKVKLYSPEMIIFEKLRAICQQMEEYKERNKKTPRARDFFDIVIINSQYPIDRNTSQDFEFFKNLLVKIFEVKKVPLELLSRNKFEKYRNFHKLDFESVKQIVVEKDKLQNFDYYFNEVLKIVDFINNRFL